MTCLLRNAESNILKRHSDSLRFHEGDLCQIKKLKTSLLLVPALPD